MPGIGRRIVANPGIVELGAGGVDMRLLEPHGCPTAVEAMCRALRGYSCVDLALQNPNTRHRPDNGLVPLGFQKSAADADQLPYAARSYSLIKPPSIGRRLIRS